MVEPTRPMLMTTVTPRAAEAPRPDAVPDGATSYGPLPLLIGVTGHRDPRDEDRGALGARVREVLAGLRERCPSTPLVLLSPLAEGADRLAAHVALAVGARLVVALPMRRELYEADFETAASRAEFAALVERAEHCFALPLLAGVSEADVVREPEARARQYAAVGAYIARHCHLLVALWDGDPEGGVGGTAQVVRFELEGVPEPYGPPRSPLDEPESQPVYQIVTPRRDRPRPERALEIVEHLPASWGDGASAAAGFARALGRVETFNRDALALGRTPTRARDQSEAYLLPPEEASALPAGLRAARRCFAVADSLALHFQRRTLRALALIVGLAFASATLLLVYYNLPWDYHPPSERRELVVLHGLALLAAFLVYQTARRGDYQIKHQDYRALAEGQRVQFFWLLAGLDASAGEHYLHKQRTDLDWTRDAIRALHVANGAGVDTTTSAAERHRRPRLVLARWI